MSTVGHHLQELAKKLGVKTRVQTIARLLLMETGETRPLVLGDLAVTAIVPPEGAPTASAGTPLTKAELEVARLAARGRSNALIAAERGTSMRTVANQLASIYTKLAVGSRSELARRLAMP